MPLEAGYQTVRLFFEKSGRAVYISHLDLTRAFSRTLSRAALPVWFTMGFHPHLYITFALPLSLGVTGLCESADFRLTEELPFDDVVARLNAAMPDGLRARSLALPQMAPKQIFWADYKLLLRCRPDEAMSAIDRLGERDGLPTEKRSKKGVRTVDIRPMFETLSVAEAPGGVTWSLRCRAGVETNLNPALVAEQLSALEGLPVAHRQITRTHIRTEALDIFR